MRLFLILVIWGLTASPALAAWVEAKSENFIFVGDVSEKKAKTIVSELEEYRAIIFKLFNWGAQSEVMPVRVYAVKSSKHIENITGNEWAAGIYTASTEGPVFIANVKGGFGRKDSARQTAYHEYTHHLISMYNNVIFPQWYNEGMAEYLSTFEANDKGVVKLGLPSNGRAYTLANKNWMDMPVILNSIKKYPFKYSSDKSNTAISQFYAQAWLATHYIQSTEGYPARLKTYLQYVNSETDLSGVFEKAFGMSEDAFEADLRKYYKKNRYPGLRITMDEAYSPQSIATRRLSKAETNFHLGEAVRRYRRNKKGFALAESYYQKALELGASKAEILASKALISLSKEDDASAKRYAKEALALAPESSRILQVAGHVGLHTFKDTGSAESKTAIKQARQNLKRAMRAEPNNIQAHYDYVYSYMLKNDPPSKQAISSAEECAFYYKGKSFVDSNLPLARVLMKGDKNRDAAVILNRARIWSESPQNRNMAAIELQRVVDKGL